MGNCEGNIYNIGMGCCQPVLGPIENYYNKWETERYVSGYTYSKEEIDEKTSGDTSGVTPSQVEAMIESARTEIEAEIPSLDGYATQEWVEDKHYLTEHQSLSAYSTTEEMNTSIEQAVSGKANANDVQAISGEIQTISSNTQTISGNLQTLSAEVQTIIVSGVSGISSAECQTMIDNSISGKADTSSLATVATSGNYNDLINKPTIPTVPTNVSAFVNDANYATSGYVDASVSGKLDTSIFQPFSASVETALGNKQDASGMTAYTQYVDFSAHTADTSIHLTSGDVQAQINESISGKTNQSDFSAHTADTTVHITAAERTSWNNKPNVWIGTQSQWAAISGSTENGTIYLVY